MAMFHVKTVVADEYDSDFVEESSFDSLVSLSSTDLFDDATSASCSSSGSMSGPLYELSELMAQLPLKRGLSKFYQGKSESFGSLANLNNIQDLAKRSHRSRSKCRSQNQALSPKITIIKSKKICSSSIAKSRLVSSLGEMSSILDTIVVQKRF